jgi:hypothetical protein
MVRGKALVVIKALGVLGFKGDVLRGALEKSLNRWLKDWVWNG